jgi:hypothetical protein
MRALQLFWAAAWRAQVAHWAVLVVLPLALVLARVLWGVALLPFALLGAGDRHMDLTAGLSPLRQPACWVVLMPCALADQTVWAMPWAEGLASDSAPDGGVAQAEPFLPLPTAITLRHVWFGLWLAWFVLHLWRREQRTRASLPSRSPPALRRRP